jgi:hypothetical protein
MIDLWERILAEILHARPGVSHHRVQILGRSLHGGYCLAHVLGSRLALFVDEAVGAVGKQANLSGRNPCLPRGDAGIGNCVGKVRARAARTSVVFSAFSRMSAIEFWLRSLSSSVSRSVSRWMRSISSGAEFNNAPRPPELAGIHRAALGPGLGQRLSSLTAPSSAISLTPVKPTPLICAVVP